MRYLGLTTDEAYKYVSVNTAFSLLSFLKRLVSRSCAECEMLQF